MLLRHTCTNPRQSGDLLIIYHYSLDLNSDLYSESNDADLLLCTKTADSSGLRYLADF